MKTFILFLLLTTTAFGQLVLSGKASFMGRIATPATAAAPPLFTNGFEEGNFTGWSSYLDLYGTNLAIISSNAHSGTYSMVFVANRNADVYVLWTNSTLVTEGYVSFWIQFNDVTAVAASSSAYQASRILDTSNNDKFVYGFYPSSGSPWNLTRKNEYYYDDGGGHFAGYVTISPAANTWYKCTYYYKVANGTGEAKAWFNGGATATVTSLSNASNLGFQRLRLGNGSFGWDIANGTLVFFDDVTIGTGVPASP